MALFTITTLCNNNCSSCINFKNNRLSHFDINKIIDKANIAKDKCDKHFCINGGEPTIHPNFFEIVSKLASYDTELLLLTNARAFSNQTFLDKFNNLNLSKKKTKIAVALYGYDSRTHDMITRSPESFNQTIFGIKNLIEAGYDVETRIIITKQNYKIIPKITEYVLNNLKPYRIAFISMKLTGEAFELRNITAVKITDILDYAYESVKKIENSSSFSNTEIKIFHFPHCILEEKYWKYTLGKTINDDELAELNQCKNCSKNKVCSHVWKSYTEVFGDDEFRTL